ncbi:MAG: DNA/RNA helicase domain-containing protein [Bifidobacterium sp.]
MLVDEGHLLLTQGNQGYSGQNQLHDILRRSRIVILIFDPKQALQTAQQWDTPTLDQLLVGDNAASGGSPYASDTSQFGPFDLCGDHYEIEHIRLSQQFRIVANRPVIDWLDHFASGAGVDPLPKDPGEYDNDGKLCCVPYEIRFFDSPLDLFKAIEQKAALPSDGVNGCGLSRVLATYDWEFTTTHTNPNDPNGLWNVELHRDVQGRWQMGLDKDEEYNFRQPWNYQLSDTSRTRGLQKNLSRTEKPYTINKIGSTFTIQGFDLNFAGVIIGQSVKYRNGRLIFDTNASRNSLATRRRKGKIDYSQKNLCNELNVLLKRGVHGLYLFAVDSQLQARLREISDAVQDVGTNNRG